MTRTQWALIALVAVLVSALWWLLLWQPVGEDITALREQVATTEAEVATQQQRAAQLREVRARSPEAEFELATADELVPAGAQLPSLLRQLQLAADDSGVRLESVTPTRPGAVAESVNGLATIQLSANATGSYFQIIDFARRLEDPEITSRGLVWQRSSFSVEDYPTLTVAVTLEAFARIPGAGPAEELPPADAAAEGDAGTEGDAVEGDEPTEPQAPVVGDDVEEVQ